MYLRIVLIATFSCTISLSQSAAAQPISTTKPVPGTVAPASSIPDLSRASYIQQMDGEFRQRDLNGDGKVSRAELERFERNVALTQAQANNQALFLQLDSDHNGVLTPAEFAGLVKDPGFVDVSSLMQRFDGNRDQIVTLVEFRIATLANFDQLDADKDGVVTDAEMRAANLKQTTTGGR